MEPQLFSCGLTMPPMSKGSTMWASMEPQLFSCGLYRDFMFCDVIVNASMEPQLFSCGLVLPPEEDEEEDDKLQWSRNFSVADCSSINNLGTLAFTGFNGAATFQLRIAAIPPTEAAIPTHQLQWSRNFSVADCFFVTGGFTNVL